jgi:hypothetical protein
LQYVLHIGTEKTGTTAIQHFLGLHMESLIEAGILPAADGFIQGSFNNLHLALASARTLGNDLDEQRELCFEDYRTEVAKHIELLGESAVAKGCRSVILSCEHLSSRLVHPEDLLNLRSLFPSGAPITIIVYVREQAALFLSAQAEGIKHGLTDLKFYDPTLKYEAYGRPYYDYDLLLRLWEDCFAGATFVVRPFDRADLHLANPVADFLHILGATDHCALVEDEVRLNRRLSPESLAFIASIGEYVRPGVRAAIVERLQQIDKNTPGSLVDPKILEDFAASLADSNQRVAQKYLNRSRLFLSKQQAPRYLDLTDPVLRLESSCRCAAGLLSAIPLWALSGSERDLNMSP